MKISVLKQLFKWELMSIVKMLANLEDEYLRETAADLKDIGKDGFITLLELK